MERTAPKESPFKFASAPGKGSCTKSPQSTMKSCSFPQIFPPLPIPPNCYSEFKQKAMALTKQKPNDLVLYRRRMGFTQKQVAHLLGHHDSSMVSHYEHGRAMP